MTLHDFAKSVAMDAWGFIPNRDIKPVHFANRFYRTLSGRSGKPKLLLKAAGGFRSGRTKFTTKQFIEDAGSCLTSRDGQSVKVEAVKKLRSALDIVLSQDRALYGYRGAYSFTLTHWRHTTSDPSDMRSGQFLAWLLANNGNRKVINRLRRAIDDETDAFYKLTAPLLDRSNQIGEVENTSPEVRELLASMEGTKPCTSIANGFTRLTKHASELDKTAFLQRVIAFGGFALYMHSVNSTADSRAGRLSPMLLITRQPSPALRNLSRRTYALGKQRLKEAFEETLTDRLENRGLKGRNRNDYIQQVREWLFPGDQSEAKRELAEDAITQFKNDFDAERDVVETDFEAFVRALRSICFNVKKVGIGKSPTRAMFYLGKHSGLLGPFGGRGEKYYRPEPQMLDALVAALLEPGSFGVTEYEFWDRAYESFGLVSGARGKRDASYLQEEWGVRASASQLKKNAEQLRKQLSRLGYARTYADGATLISPAM